MAVPLRLTVSLLLLAVALAGCSGGGGGSASTSHTPGMSMSGTMSMSASASASASATVSPSSSSSSSGPSTPQTLQKDIKGTAFPDGTFTIHVGDTVVWTNRDTTVHTVTSTGNFDSGNIAPTLTYSHKFDAAGTFQYHCNIHSSMVGTITVNA